MITRPAEGSKDLLKLHICKFEFFSLIYLNFIYINFLI